MASFNFQAKALDGKLITGQVEAENENEARAKIRGQQLIPLKIVPRKTASDSSKKSGFGLLVGPPKVKAKELQVFTRQFAVLVGAGVPVVQSLNAMVGGGRSPAMNAVLRNVVDTVEKGKNLADSFVEHPNAFDRMYCNLVKAGEEGGVLEEVLNRLATYIEKSNKLMSKITGALWYPAAIIVVAFLVIAGIMTFVIPSFVEMFEQMGQELPGLTQFVINLSKWFTANWYIVLAVLIGTPFGLSYYYKTPPGRQQIDTLLLRIPVLGELVRKGAVARFSRTLATLLSAGVRVMDSLDIAASTAGNYVIETTIIGCKDSISKGRTISEPLRASKDIPPMVGSMISVGEETGNLDTMLMKIADFYEDEVEATADTLTSLIEPLLMVVLGGIIAVLVIAMYLPIFTMAGNI